MNRPGLMAVLALINVVLMVLLAALWLNPDGSLRNARWTAPQAIRSDYLQMLPALPERKPIDTQRFLALLERPLFQLTRRPPPPLPTSAIVDAPVDNLSTAQLSGVVVGENAGSIIVTIAGKARRIRLNESVDGWSLQSIRGRSVTFAANGQTRVLQLPRATLNTFSGAALPVSAVPITVDPPAQAAAPAAPVPIQQPAEAADSGAAPIAPKPPRRSRFGP